MVRGPLSEYNARRDFRRTGEPRGTKGRGGGRRFIVQKHAATRLHFDLRLEVDGVLKSWAVTRGPSLDPRDKRLAVRTEDHPMSYVDFEGTIPTGQYGGGTVLLWDRGTWHPVEGKTAADLDEGHLHFVLDGERMRGEWLLVRMKPKPGEKRENWLLRKVADGEAGGSDDLVTRELTSVSTGRTMAAIAAGLAATRRTPAPTRRARAKLPRFRKPQLATLVDHVPDGSDWIHEIKYDGYRCLLAVSGDRAVVHTRSGLDWTARFPAVAAAAVALRLPPALIDGEIVQLDRDGNPDFSALQDAIKHGAPDVTLFAFDLLELDGEDLTKRSTTERKQRLKALLPPHDATIRIADHIVGAGPALLEALCKAGQEGIISKRADAPYRGRRTTNWLKIKCTRREEFVIIGWRESTKRGRPFSSLLLAQQAGDELVYRGRVGTGFSQETLDDLATVFRRLTRKTPPAEVPRSEARDAHWITPSLVAEIGHAELTADGILRHASFLGLRSDTPAHEVHQERAQATPGGGIT